jgi:hypothetical protein
MRIMFIRKPDTLIFLSLEGRALRQAQGREPVERVGVRVNVLLP